MAEELITVNEIPDSRSGDSTYEERNFLIEGTEDRAAARTALLASDLVPASIGSGEDELFRRGSKAVVKNHDGLADAWSATVRWELNPTYAPPFIEDSLGAISFDTTGGTEHKLYSLATAAYTASGPAAEAEDWFGLIGVGTDGSVAGVDIVAPVAAWQETRVISDEDVDAGFLRTILELTGTVNYGLAYRDNEPGENLFLGANGSRRDDGDWDITFHHGFSPNATGLTVAGISDIDKKGWDYIWVYSTGGAVPVPQYVMVEQVYRSGNHTLLD